MLSDQASPILTEAIKALLAVALQKPLHALPSLYKMNKWQNYQVYNASIHKRGTRLEVEFVPNTLGKKMSLGDLLLA